MELQLFIMIIFAFTNAHTFVNDVNRQSYEELLLNLTHDSKHSDNMAQHYKLFEHIVYNGVDNECPVQINESSSKPTSVHELRPQDIGLVGALGDSITAGNGIKATTVLGLLTQYRGMSWSIGGDENVMTIPNILRRYNPYLKGVSLMTGSVTSDNAHLNRAIPGCTSASLLNQAKDLVQHMKNKHGDVYETDWKVVTIFVGVNNICNSCYYPEKYTAVQYVRDVKSALDYLHSNMPRTFVNLVHMANVTDVHFLDNKYICTLLKTLLCYCVLPTSNLPAINKLVTEYREGLDLLVNSGQYDTKSDFAVVMQPFFLDAGIPHKSGSSEVDMSYLAPDCFHFNQKGHTKAAISLWNNMMQPVGSKQTDWTKNKGFICPNANQYLATSKNSVKL